MPSCLARPRPPLRRALGPVLHALRLPLLLAGNSGHGKRDDERGNMEFCPNLQGFWTFLVFLGGRSLLPRLLGGSLALGLAGQPGGVVGAVQGGQGRSRQHGPARQREVFSRQARREGRGGRESTCIRNFKVRNNVKIFRN